MVFFLKNGSGFWHRFGSRNRGTTKWNPTVCSTSLSPHFGNQKSTRFLEPTSVFWEPFFPDFGASGMACSRPTEQPETIGCAFPFHWLLPEWPQVVIVTECFSRRCFRASRSSIVDTWSGFFNSAKRFICLHGWAHCRRSDPKYMEAFHNVWKSSNTCEYKGRCHQLAIEQWARRRCRPV